MAGPTAVTATRVNPGVKARHHEDLATTPSAGRANPPAAASHPVMVMVVSVVVIVMVGRSVMVSVVVGLAGYVPTAARLHRRQARVAGADWHAGVLPESPKISRCTNPNSSPSTSRPPKKKTPRHSPSTKRDWQSGLQATPIASVFAMKPKQL